MEEAPPLEELDVLEAVDSKGEASYSYAAISTYSQTGSYPPDAEKQEKRGLRKRAKYFVVRWQTTLTSKIVNKISLRQLTLQSDVYYTTSKLII